MQAATTHPLSLILMGLLFGIPFSSGNPVFIMGTICLLWLLIIYVSIREKDGCRSLARELKTHHPAIFYALLAFGISSLASYLPVMFSPTSVRHKAAASMQYLFYIQMLLYAFSLARLSVTQQLSPSRLFTAYSAGCILLALLLLGFYLSGMAEYAPDWTVRAPFGEHLRIMGIIASIATLASVTRAILSTSSSPWRLWPALASTLIGSAFLIWTGSRTSMLVTLTLTVALFFLVALIQRQRLPQAIAVMLVLGLSVPLAQQFSIFPWSGLNRVIQASTVTPEEQAMTTSTEDIQEKITSGRSTMWRQAWAGVKEAPWFGYGPGGYFFHPMHYQDFIHPHNFLLQFLVEWGFVGGTLLLFFLASLAWQGLKRLPAAVRDNDRDYVVSAMIAIGLGVTSLTDGIFFISQGLFCITTAFAAFPFMTMKEKQRLSQA